MYKHRYHKTTFGVPTELVFGGIADTLPANVTQQNTLELNTINPSVTGVIYPIRHVINQLATPTVATATGCTITTVTGVFTVGTLTSTQVFVVGQKITGTGTTAGTTLTALLTGTGGTGSTFSTNTGVAVTSFTATGTGTTGGHRKYILKNNQAWNDMSTAGGATFVVASSSASTSMVVTSVTSGVLAIGQIVSTSGALNAVISSIGTTAGGVGTYTLTAAQTFVGGVASSSSPAGATLGSIAGANLGSQYIQFASCTYGDVPLSATYQMSTMLKASTIRVVGVEPYQAATAQVSTLTTSGTYSVGQTAIVKVVETTPGTPNLPFWDYEIPLTTASITTANGMTPTEVVTQIVAKIGSTATPAVPTSASTVMSTTKTDEWFYFTGSGAVLTITAAAGAKGRSFKVVFTVQTTTAVPTVSAWTLATFATTTAASWGYGTADQVTNLIQEDAIRRGVGHYYPNQNATAAEFGTPDAAIAACINATPTTITLQGEKWEPSPTPSEQHVNTNHYITIVCGPNQAASILANFPG